ncbi:zinc ribbon domain-containing protein [Solihabitans fulvus]|uniref:Zinc ribbon domain-containing protein n=1 Tax=Solihabitans fulvus TaxID=1892852 RepID=A0A5B2X6S7_9PSEU|nr:zinc ribbon domain-containing protein [Solihabitans fulvus]KAA2258799.1 zinc ribbon domain-containing protein [Solihabitans fulvus]
MVAPIGKPGAVALPPKEAPLSVVGAVGGGEQPEALRPQEQRRRPHVVVKSAPTRRLEPGDLVCGDCGEGNPQTRKFCSRCGASLVDAESVRRRWWQRLLPRRGAKVRKAGERPKRGRNRGKSKLGKALGAVFPAIRKFVAVALILVGIAYGLFAPFRGWVNEQVVAGRQNIEWILFGKFDPVHPTGVKAAVQLADHPGAAATDGLTNTYWAAPVNGAEPALVFTFDHPVNLDRAIIRSGASGDFQAQHRPQKLHLVYSTGKTHDVDLSDSPDPQEIQLSDGAGVSSVEIHVVALYRSMTGSAVAVTEIELFQKSR